MVNYPASRSLSAHLADLHSEDSAVRRYARENLVQMGRAALPALAGVLHDPDSHVRWEAAAAFLEMADPASIPALITALDDEAIAVRWLASEALVQLGELSLPHVLRGILENAASPNFREGAERVLRHVSGSLSPEEQAHVRPVLDALDKPAPAEAAPGAALRALDALRESGAFAASDEALAA